MNVRVLGSVGTTPVSVWRLGDDPKRLTSVLDRGGVLAVPTGSSYALAGDPSSALAVERIFAVKGRPAGKPLPVVAASHDQFSDLGVAWPTPASGGLETLWPGPLSLLLPLSRNLPAVAGRDRVAVRIPGYSDLRRLLAELGRPLTATSANRSGEAPILEPEKLAPLVEGHEVVIVDGGRLSGAAPSTLVEVGNGVATVVRTGRIGLDELRRAAPNLVFRQTGFSAASVEIPAEEAH